MLPYIKVAIALAVFIPVLIIVLIAVYIWLYRRRRESKSPLDEEVIQSFQVNSVHKLVKVEDIEARASPIPFSPDDYAQSIHSSIVSAETCVEPTQRYTYSLQPWSTRVESSPPDYSDKQVVPDPTLPEAISGPTLVEPLPRTVLEQTPQSLPEVTRKTCLERAVAEEKKQRLTADEIIGIDRTFWLQDLPAYQPGRPSVLHVATANLGEPNEFVSPWDVEFKPNPIIFSHLTAPTTNQDSVAPVSAISAYSPTSPVDPRQPGGPFEMDAVESVFNPWCHEPLTIIAGIPHRWEKSLGANRMFFNAEHDLFPNRKRRSGSEHYASVESPQRKKTSGYSSPGTSTSSQPTPSPESIMDLDPTISSSSASTSSRPSSSQTVKPSGSRHRSQRKGSQRRQKQTSAAPCGNDSATASKEDSPIDGLFAQPLMWNRRDNNHWEPTNGKNPQQDPIAWDVFSMAYATQLAAQHEQQAMFFEKFYNMPVTPLSPIAHTREEVIFEEVTFDDASLEGINFDQMSYVQIEEGFSTATTSLRSWPTEDSNSLRTPITPPSPFLDGSRKCPWERSLPSVTSEPMPTPPVARVKTQKLKFECTGCHEKFRTPGLQKNHFNRKHNLRYNCDHCGSAFGLRKDLERHQSTVHKDLYKPVNQLLCPNSGCATPNKVFNRRDNFNRHVERCRHAVETRGTAQ